MPKQRAQHQATVTEQDWPNSPLRTLEWEQSVQIVRWEHDFELGIYIIDYNDKPQTEQA